MAAAFTLETDEADLLKAYHIDTLEPRKWHDTSVKPGDANGPAGGAAGADDLAPLSSLDEPDPLGLRSTLPPARTLDRETRTAISLSSKHFDPRTFLSIVHPDATFADLSRGLNFLRESIESRSEALKVLVEDDFDRFVAVKATTDAVHRDMRESEDGPLREGQGHGVQALQETLAKASAKADQVFMPVLENNLKAVKLRSTLAVFERSRFFFNLPGSLGEAIEQGRYEAALRDYKKGRYLRESRPGQLLAAFGSADAPNSKTTSAKQQAQQERVFAKVWDGVEATVADMQTRLFALLREPKRGVEEQEKTIEILLELDPAQDPVSVFLESQHNHIRSLMRSAYDAAVGRVEGAAAIDSLETDSDKDRARDIRAGLRGLSRGDAGQERTLGAEGWKAIHDLVKSLGETVVQTLPSFWRVCKNQAEGRVKSQSASIQSKSRAWATESVEAYVSMLSHFFSLTDVAIASRQPQSPLSEWVPKRTSSLTAAHHMRATLGELGDAVTDLIALDIGDTPAALRGLLNNARYRFTETLCHLWHADAKLLYMLEDWTPSPEQEATTLHLRDLAAFHRSNTVMAYQLCGGQERELGPNGRMRESTPIPAEFSARVKAAFFDTLYAYLDGLVHLAFSEYDPLEPNLTTSVKSGSVDVQDLDTRILLSVTNLEHMTKGVVPSLARHFKDLFHVKMSDDLRTIDEVAAQLDDILFKDFTKRKAASISAIFRVGILESGINWQTIPKPAEVHPFIYEALLSLVQVHAQVRAVAAPLVGRAITTLVEELTLVILEAFEKIPRFGMGGMLQATLEIEFMHQTISAFVNSVAEERLKDIYESISRKYQRAPGAAGDAEAASLQRELEEVKRTLVRARKQSALHFLCFRKSREERERSSVAAAGKTGSAGGSLPSGGGTLTSTSTATLGRSR